MKRLAVVLPATLVAFAGCADAPTGITPDAAISGELVITPGVAAPKRMPKPDRPLLSEVSAASINLGGSVSSPLTLKAQACGADASAGVTITYTVTGRQANAASFKVNTRWEYDGSSWAGSLPTTVDVPARAQGAPATSFPVEIDVVNASPTSSGISSFTISPFGLVTTPQATLSLTNANAHPDATMHVEFGGCAPSNTPPVIVVPSDITLEATSSAGAVANFVVTASDAEDGDISASVSCTPASGSTLPLGETTVSCSVTDAGGLTATGSFKVNVVDTTPAYFTGFPSGTLNVIAVNSAGATIDLDTLGITVADVGGVSEPATWGCDYVAGTVLPIGSTTTVSCTAKDAIGNESAASTFQVFVGLNVSATGFLPPLRMTSPFSSHKRGSTIPHKFLPPTYADGTPAIDLASGLRLVLQRVSGATPDAEIEVNDYSAGSTEWRYDPTSGHYIFNLKSQTAWDLGTWATTVSYAGITLATTRLELRK